MSYFQAAARRGLIASGPLRLTTTRAVRRPLQDIVGRRFASDGHAHAPSSDLPWLIGAVAVTVPGCWYLWPEHTSHADAHHGLNSDHAELDDEKHDTEEQSANTKTSRQPEVKTDPGEEDDSGDSGSSGPSSEQDSGDEADNDSSGEPDKKSDSSAPEKSSNKKVNGVQSKGKTSAGDENNEMIDTRKREPDERGGFNDSDSQKDLDAGKQTDEAGKPSGAIDSKQAGFSTTQSKHSTQVDKDPEKSKKGEGIPETAKSQTTIDPGRPQI